MNSIKRFSFEASKYLIVGLVGFSVIFANVLPAQAATLDDLMVTLKSLQTTLQSLVSGKVLGVSTGAYQYVKPSDVGVTIGLGSIAPAPTVKYTGRYDIRQSGVIQNVIIDDCLEIYANDVTLRNVKINCATNYGVKLVGGVSNFVMEHSLMNCTGYGKMFYFESGGPNAKIRNNEATGCEDFFFLNGNLNGVEINHNYMHDTNITPDSHSDGFQIGEGSRAYGVMRVNGNYFDAEKPNTTGQTGLLFTTNYSEVDITLENNYIAPWGTQILRCGGTNPKCSIKNNVFLNSLKTRGEISLIYTGVYYSNSFECNRYQDGSLMQEIISGADLIQGPIVTTNCPAMGQIVTPTPTPAPVLPTLTLTLNPTSVINGGASTLTWTTANATACTASGAWSGTKSISSSQSTGSLTSAGTQTFTLTCTGAGGSVSKNVVVTVAAPIISGSTPTPVSDTIDPVVTFTAPKNGSTVLVGSTVNIAVTATDANAIGGANFYINGVLTCSDTTAPYTCPLPVSTTAGVQYTLNTKVWDASNNVGEATVNVTSATAPTPTPTPTPIPTPTPTPTPTDTDRDTIADTLDNCVSVANTNQSNNDRDTQGDACDADDDNDGIADTAEKAGCQFNNSATCGVTVTPTPVPATPNITTTSNLNVRSTAGGTLLGTQPVGATGISDSTKQVTLNGTTWIYVNFTTGVDGYVSATYLTGSGVSTNNQTLIQSLLAQLAVLQAALAALLAQ